MVIIILSLAIIVLLGIVSILLIKLFPKRIVYPYYKNPYFMSNAEKSFFKILQQIVEDNYFIFPQVSLNSLLKIKKQGQEYWQYTNKIREKSVDFVLADIKTLTPCLVIELNDGSHRNYDRIQRDEFLKEALELAHIPFLSIENRFSYNIVELRKLIQGELQLP